MLNNSSKLEKTNLAILALSFKHISECKNSHLITLFRNYQKNISHILLFQTNKF